MRTKNWVEINDDSRGAYNTNSQIKSETPKLKSSLWVIIVMYIYFVKGTISVVTGGTATGAAANTNNKKVIFKNCP